MSLSLVPDRKHFKNSFLGAVYINDKLHYGEYALQFLSYTGHSFICLFLKGS